MVTKNDGVGKCTGRSAPNRQDDGVNSICAQGVKSVDNLHSIFQLRPYNAPI